MKKIIATITIFSSLILCNITNSNAGILSPLADSFITIELSKSVLSHKSMNAKFENRNDFFENIRQFEDLALGGHLRFGKYFGVNVNWAQTSLQNNSLYGVGNLNQKAKFKSDQINTTALIFLPIIPKRAELFIEGGSVDIGSKLNYTTTGGIDIERKSHQTMGLYGLGAQISLFGSDFIRLSAQRYAGRIGLLETNYTTFRLGYLKSF